MTENAHHSNKDWSILMLDKYSENINRYNYYLKSQIAALQSYNSCVFVVFIQ